MEMTHEQILRDQIRGLEALLMDLRGDELRFVKAQGIDEQAENLIAEAESLRPKIAVIKEELEAARGKRNEAIAPTAKALAESMSAVLPSGEAMFDISSDGSVFLGLAKDADKKIAIPYQALSGGELVAFDAALAHALKADCLIIEAAEMDSVRLLSGLESLAKLKAQVIVNTCHLIPTTPDEFETMNFFLQEAADEAV